MSRLNSFLNRLTAQKLLIEQAAGLVQETPGAVLDLGLGAGRSYDHMVRLFPDREVYALDRRIDARPAYIPRASHVIVGEIAETLPFCRERIGQPIAVLHNDLGSGDDLTNAIVGRWLAPLVDPLMAVGGVVITSFPMDLTRCTPLALPAGIKKRRYHIYRCVEAS